MGDGSRYIRYRPFQAAPQAPHTEQKSATVRDVKSVMAAPVVLSASASNTVVNTSGAIPSGLNTSESKAQLVDVPLTSPERDADDAKGASIIAPMPTTGRSNSLPSSSTTLASTEIKIASPRPRSEVPLKFNSEELAAINREEDRRIRAATITQADINRARIEQVRQIREKDPDAKRWQDTFFASAVRAIEYGDAKGLHAYMGSQDLFLQRQLDFIDNGYTYSDIDTLVNEAESKWLEHVRGFFINGSANYSAEDFDGAILGHDNHDGRGRDIIGSDVNERVKKFKQGVKKQLSKIEGERVNQGALFLPHDIQARYVDHLVARFRNNLLDAHTKMRALLIKKGVLNKDLTPEEKSAAKSLLQAEIDQRTTAVNASKKAREAKRRRYKKAQKEEVAFNAIDSSDVCSKTESSTSVSTHYYSSTSCDSTEKDEDEEDDDEDEKSEVKQEESKETKDGDDLVEYRRQGIKDPNLYRNENGQTLMHYAIAAFARDPTQERLNVIETLLKAGVSPFVTDINGEDAFEAADFQDRLEYQLIDEGTRNQKALLFWQVLFLTAKYMGPSHSDYNQKTINKTIDYIELAKTNLDSWAHWLTHDFNTSNYERFIQVKAILRAAYWGNLTLCDVALEKEAKPHVAAARARNGVFTRSILGELVGESLHGSKLLQVSWSDVLRANTEIALGYRLSEAMLAPQILSIPRPLSDTFVAPLSVPIDTSTNSNSNSNSDSSSNSLASTSSIPSILGATVSPSTGPYLPDYSDPLVDCSSVTACKS